MARVSENSLAHRALSLSQDLFSRGLLLLGVRDGHVDVSRAFHDAKSQFGSRTHTHVFTLSLAHFVCVVCEGCEGKRRVRCGSCYYCFCCLLVVLFLLVSELLMVWSGLLESAASLRRGMGVRCLKGFFSLCEYLS